MRICTRCGAERPLDTFRLRSDGYTDRVCKVCARTSGRLWRAKHPERRAAIRARYAAKVKTLVRDHKSAHPTCADCKQDHPYWRLDFDHLPGCEKRFDLGKIGGRTRSVILRELAKCELVCANCHRDRTRARGYLG